MGKKITQKYDLQRLQEAAVQLQVKTPTKKIYQIEERPQTQIKSTELLKKIDQSQIKQRNSHLKQPTKSYS